MGLQPRPAVEPAIAAVRSSGFSSIRKSQSPSSSTSLARAKEARAGNLFNSVRAGLTQVREAPIMSPFPCGVILESIFSGNAQAATEPLCLKGFSPKNLLRNFALRRRSLTY